MGIGLTRGQPAIYTVVDVQGLEAEFNSGQPGWPDYAPYPFNRMRHQVVIEVGDVQDHDAEAMPSSMRQ